MTPVAHLEIKILSLSYIGMNCTKVIQALLRSNFTFSGRYTTILYLKCMILREFHLTKPSEMPEANTKTKILSFESSQNFCVLVRTSTDMINIFYSL